MRFCNQGPSLVVHTPAKLNLFLEVLGRRPDGYHELETIMVSIGLYDTLLFTEAASHQTRLRCHHVDATSAASPAFPPGDDNLIVQAAELLRAASGCERGVTIDLWKRIPLQAGLGGGSSDAAATLVGLNRHWQCGLMPSQLHGLAARLGSDVNFFLDSPLAAVCTGRGERVVPLAVPDRLHFVVACPASGLSTAEVFRHWRRGAVATRSVADVAVALTSGRIAGRAHVLHNALEAAASELNTDIKATLQALRGSGVTPALMSGSGTSCFALCRSARHAHTIAGRLQQCRHVRVLATDSRA